MRARISRGTPGPESSTTIRTQPSRACVTRCTIAGLRPRTTYSALVTRLITTCCSSWPRPRTAGADWSSSVRSSTLSARSTRWRISATSRTRSFICTRVGAARKPQQAARDARGAVHFPRDRGRRGARLRVLAGAPEQLGLDADRRERVVDLVRHAARDLAHGGELLARDQLALGTQLVGPVVQGHEQVVAPHPRQPGDGTIADAPVPGRLGDEHASVPGRARLRPGEH